MRALLRWPKLFDGYTFVGVTERYGDGSICGHGNGTGEGDGAHGDKGDGIDSDGGDYGDGMGKGQWGDFQGGGAGKGVMYGGRRS